MFNKDNEKMSVFESLPFEAVPLFQTSFFPDFMQVKVFPLTTSMFPDLVHLAPALAAAFAGLMGEDRKRESTDKKAISLLFISRE
jgi:hypothetical protein